MSKYLGIDPGATGALAFITDLEMQVVDMPANPADLADTFEMMGWGNAGWRCVIEKAQAMPKQGVSSTFKIGYNYGLLIGMLAASRVPYVEVRPSEWKRAMGLLGKNKEASRALARTLWPEAPLGRKMDHGRAEALLLAHYGRERGL